MANILFFVSVDRTTLILQMQDYIKRCKPHCKIVVLSDNIYCSSRHFVDQFVELPSNRAIKRSEFIKNVILSYNIKGVFSASNFDLEVILELKNWLKEKNINYFNSTIDTLNCLLSKEKTHQLLFNAGIRTPNIYSRDDFMFKIKKYPLIVKPNYGQGSKYTFLVNNIDEALFYLDFVSDPIIQDHINGTHYTIDCFTDVNGILLLIVPRIRLVVDGANSIISKIDIDSELVKLAFEISKLIILSGPWNFQVVKNSDDTFVYDINPRISSGIVFSIMAGYPFHEYIVDFLIDGVNSEKIQTNQGNGLILAKFNSICVIQE